MDAESNECTHSSREVVVRVYIIQVVCVHYYHHWVTAKLCYSTHNNMIVNFFSSVEKRPYRSNYTCLFIPSLLLLSSLPHPLSPLLLLLPHLLLPTPPQITLLPPSLPPNRYVVATDRVLFMTRDGSKAWQIKDYLVAQEECTTVNFEHLSFPCKGTPEGDEGYQHPKDEL